MAKYKDEIAKYQKDSYCRVEFETNAKGLRRIRVDFCGPVANIPSLKNAKLPGRNFLSPTVRARLKVMDDCYRSALGGALWESGLGFGPADVALVLVCAKRKVSFDTDNCLATVRDWLEPGIKKVGKGKHRGWGVGLIENDRQVRGLAIYDKDLGGKLSKSILVVERLDSPRSLPAMIESVFREIEQGELCPAN